MGDCGGVGLAVTAVGLAAVGAFARLRPAVILAPILPGAPIQTVERDVREWRIRYGAYALDELGDGPAVWGATARVLGQLGAILAS